MKIWSRKRRQHDATVSIGLETQRGIDLNAVCYACGWKVIGK